MAFLAGNHLSISFGIENAFLFHEQNTAAKMNFGADL